MECLLCAGRVLGAEDGMALATLERSLLREKEGRLTGRQAFIIQCRCCRAPIGVDEGATEKEPIQDLGSQAVSKSHLP